MFDVDDAQRRAAARLTRTSTRRRRADAGRSRLPEVVLDAVRDLTLGADRPPVAHVRRRLEEVCRERGIAPPARATLYALLGRMPTRGYRTSDLPPHVRHALYNLAQDVEVPGHQLVFHCLNYGSLAAVGFAAGLPWLALYQAARLRGWRPRSLGLLRAAMRARGIA